MIIGVGVDAVEIERFAKWNHFKPKTLTKIFTSSEITYCLSDKKLSSQRFASRFAAKEAAYKAMNNLLNSMNFVQFCKFIEIKNGVLGKPEAVLKEIGLKNIKIELSITHTRSTAIAFVIAQKEIIPSDSAGIVSRNAETGPSSSPDAIQAVDTKRNATPDKQIAE